jgi:peptide/nickel transport system permease protein
MTDPLPRQGDNPVDAAPSDAAATPRAEPVLSPTPNFAPALSTSESSRPSTTAASSLPPTVSPGYWHYVSRAFYRPLATKLAVAFALLIVAIAVLVPFIANASPYTIELKDSKTGAYERSYPVFAQLSSIDLGILIGASAAVAFYVVHLRLRRRPLEQRQRQRRVALLWILPLAVVSITLIALFHHDYQGYTDYPAVLADGTARHAIFPPIRWGYADAEPLEKDLVYKSYLPGHPLGTDGNGQDALGRLLWACRIVLGIGLIAELISVIIGIIYGAIVGFFSGVVDILGMRLVEMVESIPTLFLLLIFVSIFGRKIWIITLILGLTGWTGLARFVRAEYLRIRQLDFVSAARASGVPLPSILFRHILPNALSPLLVVISFGVAGAITSESILSFLGVGLEPPIPSWGNMLNEAGNPAEIFRPWLAMPPGIMIFCTILACNLIGESLRDALDPKLNRLL